MWDPEDRYARTSFVAPVNDPGTSPSDQPQVVVGINADWLPYLTGCLMQLCQPTAWNAAPDDIPDLIGRVTDLIATINTAGGSDMGQYYSHNDTPFAYEAGLDIEDSATVAATLTNYPTNARVKISLASSFSAPVYQFPSFFATAGGNGRTVRRGRDGNLYVTPSLPAGAAVGHTSYVVYKSVDGGATWTQAAAYFSNTAITTSPSSLSLAVDAAGNIGLLFIATDPAFPLCTNVLFSMWNGSAWSAFQDVSSYNAATSNAVGAQLHVSTAGVWHATWAQKDASSTTSARVQYAARTAGGAGTWGGVVNVGAANSNASAPMILLDSGGFVRIVAKAGASGFLTLYTNASGSWVASASAVVNAPGFVVIDSTNLIYVAGSTAGAIQTVTAAGVWTALTTTGYLMDTTQAIGELYIDDADAIYATRQATPIIQKYSAGAWAATFQVIIGPVGTTTRTLIGTQDAPIAGCILNAIFGTLTPFTVTG